MKYKVGDKVKIKTWEEMEKEYGSIEDHICCYLPYFDHEEKKFNELNCNRILTVEKIEETIVKYYLMKEIDNYWSDDMIQCLAKDYVEEVFYSASNRYEILDLRGHS